MFTDLFRLASRFELAIPPEIATVLRALATLEGTLALLTPGIDIAAEARQYAVARGRAQISHRGDGGAAPGAAPAAPPVRPRHRRPGTGQARPQRAAVRRRARPPGGHRPDAAVPACVPRRDVRYRRRDPARHDRRARD